MTLRTVLRASALMRNAAGGSGTTFMTSRTLASTASKHLKETAGNDPAYHKHKEDSLHKQKEGKGHWKPELASSSEEAIKADRAASSGSTQDDMERLQQRTKDAAQETQKHGTSMSDGL